jgi:hypothetical protein
VIIMMMMIIMIITKKIMIRLSVCLPNYLCFALLDALEHHFSGRGGGTEQGEGTLGVDREDLQIVAQVPVPFDPVPVLVPAPVPVPVDSSSIMFNCIVMIVFQHYHLCVLLNTVIVSVDIASDSMVGRRRRSQQMIVIIGQLLGRIASIVVVPSSNSCSSISTAAAA